MKKSFSILVTIQEFGEFAEWVKACNSGEDDLILTSEDNLDIYWKAF